MGILHEPPATVLIHVANHPHSTLREITQAVAATERSVSSSLRALEDDDIMAHKKEGRRNTYWVNFRALPDFPLGGN